MTHTEQITNAVYERRMSTEAFNLGTLAAQCELWASSEHTPPWERVWLKARAAEYREAQYEANKLRVLPDPPQPAPAIPKASFTGLQVALIVEAIIAMTIASVWYVAKWNGWL